MTNIKILVIEDNPVIIRMNEKLLGSMGYQVITARDGQEGLERAKEDQPDIILLDIILPVLHGFEVCKALRNEPVTKNIPIIFMTGTGLEDVAQQEPGLNVEGYISKPYDINKMHALIQDILGKKG